MPCHLCQAEAVSRCYNCGELVCEEHGKGATCAGCSASIMAGDRRPDRFSETPVGVPQNHGWWRPQQAEEYIPPACYQCQGLTRSKCRNCEQPYCMEHAGPNGLCQECDRSANLGLWICAGMFALMALSIFCNWLFG
jgi:hypothetical protein